jgi:hypothetical protein
MDLYRHFSAKRMRLLPELAFCLLLVHTGELLQSICLLSSAYSYCIHHFCQFTLEDYSYLQLTF